MTGVAQPLVGRDRELEFLAQLLEETCARNPRFVFVTGEPGIGKTCLLLELARQAERRGCLALRGGASEFERELPFGLVVDALDEYLEAFDPSEFNRLSAEDVSELARVFPALSSLNPESEQPTTAAERFRAHRAVRDVIERLAARQPLVLMLDDLHWADGASLELTSYLLRHPPRAAVMLAATFRSGQADRALVAAIERASTEAGIVHTIPVGPLTPADARTLIEGVGGPESEHLYEASGGNPFYLLQLASMTDHGNGRRAGGGANVPDAISAAIVSELNALSPMPRRLAEAAAVAGDPFELDLAVETGGMGEAEALEALDELVGRDLVRPAEVPRRFYFRHPLVRRAVYESCPPGVRLAAHERTAEVLAARAAPATARAHHVEHAARHGDLAAVAVLREAGEATAQRAPVSAARWFATALGLLPEAAPHTERVELLIALAGAQAATGRFEESREALLETIALTPGDDEPLRVKLVGMCAGLEQLLGHHEAARTRLIAALGALSSASSSHAVALMIQLAVGDFYRMEYAAMRGWGERALAAAQRLSDPPLTAASTAVLAVAAAFMGAVPDAKAHSSAAAALVDSLPDDELGLRLDALANLATAELYLHRYPLAGGHAQRGLAIARATGQGDMSPVLVPVLSNVLHTTGRIAESAALLDGAVEAARLSGNAQALGWNLLSRAFTAVAAGDLETALGAGQESVDVTRDLDDSLVCTYANVALASALYENGEAGRAVEVLLSAAGGDELPLIASGWKANYFELLTRCWLTVGQPAAAERAAARAAAIAAELELPLTTAMAQRAAAAVALEGGDPATAASQALAAAEAADEVGARVEAARARTLAGRALDRANERARAVAELERAAQQLDVCGAVRYRQQAELELRRLGRHVHRRTRPGKAGGAGIETLTEREGQVARLLVDRRTNPEIAAELFLSVKTVETHLRSIFRKL
ncbi:MAG TPA: AAA family ATPase, partial [Thermoleophilaceae bacterium]|nr:AAA family ATPase [Thermoleophilaceae bacterium]